LQRAKQVVKKYYVEAVKKGEPWKTYEVARKGVAAKKGEWKAVQEKIGDLKASIKEMKAQVKAETGRLAEARDAVEEQKDTVRKAASLITQLPKTQIDERFVKDKWFNTKTVEEKVPRAMLEMQQGAADALKEILVVSDSE
jgi:hypothetical protein